MDAAFEMTYTSKFEAVRIGGIVGIPGSTKVANLVYPQPEDAQFDMVTVPRLTIRKLKNRRYRNNRSGRGIMSVGKGVDKKNGVVANLSKLSKNA